MILSKENGCVYFRDKGSFKERIFTNVTLLNLLLYYFVRCNKMFVISQESFTTTENRILALN